MADDVSAPAIVFLPRAIAEDRGGCSLWLILARVEVAAEQRRNAERPEEARADARTADWLESA